MVSPEPARAWSTEREAAEAEGRPTVEFRSNRLGESYLLLDGDLTSMAEWIRSVERRLAALGRRDLP